MTCIFCDYVGRELIERLIDCFPRSRMPTITPHEKAYSILLRSKCCFAEMLMLGMLILCSIVGMIILSNRKK
jgi:hypothetical protein